MTAADLRAPILCKNSDREEPLSSLPVSSRILGHGELLVDVSRLFVFPLNECDCLLPPPTSQLAEVTLSPQMSPKGDPWQTADVAFWFILINYFF